MTAITNNTFFKCKFKNYYIVLLEKKNKNCKKDMNNDVIMK
jgi:hypothetical protein